MDIDAAVDAVVTTPPETPSQSQEVMLDRPSTMSLAAGEIADDILDASYDDESVQSSFSATKSEIQEPTPIESNVTVNAQHREEPPLQQPAVTAAEITVDTTTPELRQLDTQQRLIRSGTVSPWEQQYIKERQPEIATARQRFELFSNGRLICLVMVIVIVGTVEMLKMNTNENHTTQTEYIAYETLDFPYISLFYAKEILDCRPTEVEYFQSTRVDPVIEYGNLSNFVYDESVTNWASLSIDVGTESLHSAGNMIVPPFGLQLKVNDYLALHTECTTNDIGHPEPLDCCLDALNETSGLRTNYSHSYRSPYWTDLLYLQMNHWLFYSVIIGHTDELFEPTERYGYCEEGLKNCISDNVFKKLSDTGRNYGFIPMGTVTGTTLQMIEIRDHTVSPRVNRKVFNQFPNLEANYVEKILYNASGWTDNPGSYWKLGSEQWYVTDISAMKLRVTTKERKTVFEVFAELGGFLSIINRLSRWIVMLAVLGVSVNVAWLGLHINVKGLAYDAPLDEDTERRINLLLERRRMVTETGLEMILEDLKKEIREEVRKEIQSEMMGKGRESFVK